MRQLAATRTRREDRMNWKWLSEFRDFALKGSVVDLAIGVIIGAAFGKIVSALVENILMPPIGFLLKRRDDLAKGGTDDHAYGQIDHAALEREIAKFRQPFPVHAILPPGAGGSQLPHLSLGNR